jgi:hypothetical protein
VTSGRSSPGGKKSRALPGVPGGNQTSGKELPRVSNQGLTLWQMRG